MNDEIDLHEYVEWHLTYMGHILDVFDSLKDAADARRKLVADIRANKLPDFLDADDITGAEDFPIRKTRHTYS